MMWARGSSGKANPLDPKPTPDGNVRIVGTEPDGTPKIEYLSKANVAQARLRGEKLYTSHFATCPNRKQHRKKAA